MISRVYGAVITIMCAFVMFTNPIGYGGLPEKWGEGAEKNIFGHSFDEEYWTNTTANTTKDGGIVKVTTSYVNAGRIQAFLIAFNSFEKGGKVSTLPYQLFGMHYYTPDHQEVLIGSTFAFLLAYNNTYETDLGMPDPRNEQVFYVIPFGVGDSLNNSSYAPVVEPIPAKPIGEHKYEFGMRYKNMYAKVIDASKVLGFLFSAALPLYIAKFSSFEIRYVLDIDLSGNKAYVETYYTLGQVTDLWILGVKSEVNALPDTFALAPVHYMVHITTSPVYKGSESKKAIPTGTLGEAEENISMEVGKNDRALDIGFHRKYSLYNEKAGDYASRNETAIPFTYRANLMDVLLVAWQYNLSRNLFIGMSYGLSKYAKKTYSSPEDMANKGGHLFKGSSLWFGIAFPHWYGYRVIHDPTYIAYIGEEEAPEVGTNLGGLCLLLIILIVAVAVVYYLKKR